MIRPTSPHDAYIATTKAYIGEWFNSLPTSSYLCVTVVHIWVNCDGFQPSKIRYPSGIETNFAFLS
jgi:hypothetical protein